MNPFPFVAPEILQQLASVKPYLLAVLKKGPNYESEDSLRIIQAEHLPHLFKQREQGVVSLSLPVMDQTNIAAIAIYTLPSKEQVQQWLDQDPAVKAGIFTYEVVNGMGLPGDALK